MNKKHFVDIAEVMKLLGELSTPLGLSLLHKKVSEAMADKLEKYNPLFDRKRFLIACGYKIENKKECLYCKKFPCSKHK